jgi:hypothetical protein
MTSDELAKHLGVLSAALKPVDDETVALVRAVRQLLAEMELLAHGGVTAWNSSGRGKAGSRPPSGESGPPHVEWRERFDAAPLGEWPVLLEEARGELEGWRRRTAPAVGEWKSLGDLIIEDGVGWDPDAVARRFGVSAAYVCRIRLRRKVAIEDGRGEEPDRKLSRDERRRRVRDLKDQGMTVRQIATLLNVSVGTVAADGKAA